VLAYARGLKAQQLLHLKIIWQNLKPRLPQRAAMQIG
jgi:hypothetical protein